MAAKASRGDWSSACGTWLSESICNRSGRSGGVLRPADGLSCEARRRAWYRRTSGTSHSSAALGRSVGSRRKSEPRRAQTAGQHAPRPRRARPGAPTDGAQEGGALGGGLGQRNAKTWPDAHLGRIAIDGKTRTAQQRAMRSLDILAVRDSPSRCAGRWRGGLISPAPIAPPAAILPRGARPGRVLYRAERDLPRPARAGPVTHDKGATDT